MCSQNIKVRILYNYTNSKNMYISGKKWYNTNIRTKLYKIRTKKRCFMANKTTVALTENQFREIIKTMYEGGAGFRPNPKIATILTLEANLGLRISDILNLKMKDIIRDGGRYRLNIIEEKTGKKRTFTVPYQIKQYLDDYCELNDIPEDEKIFPVTARAVQKYLKVVCDYVGFENIGTHSFRKYYATDIYQKNDNDIILVQKLLQHSSPVTTQRYIGIMSKRVEKAIQDHLIIIDPPAQQ